MTINTLRRTLVLPVLAAIALSSGAFLQAYTSIGHVWGTNRVNYYVNPASKWVSPSAAVWAVQTAAAVWNDQGGANIQLVYAGTTNSGTLALNGRNDVFFRDAGSGSVAETWYWWDGTGRLVDFDIIHYEGSYQFFAGSGCSGGIYIENVAAHEFGHGLGLGHSSLYGVTMQPAMQSYCDTSQLTLEADDVAGIQAHYPGSSPAPAPVNTAPSAAILSPSNGASVLEGTVVTFSGSATDAQDGNISHKLVWTSSRFGQIGTGASIAVAVPVGTDTVTASVRDSGGMSAASQVSVTATQPTQVEPTPVPPPPGPAPTPSAPVLTARGYKTKGQQKVDLSWSGLSGGVEVFRNGSRINTANSNPWTDAINSKGGGTYTYQVCAGGVCSTNATVRF